MILLQKLVSMVTDSWRDLPHYSPIILYVAAIKYQSVSGCHGDMDGTVDEQVSLNEVHSLIHRALQNDALNFLLAVLSNEDLVSVIVQSLHLISCHTPPCHTPPCHTPSLPHPLPAPLRGSAAMVCTNLCTMCSSV